MPFDYILLFIVLILPLIYKLLFWLYTIQLKEYRWDRFKEYIFTPQGKSAFLNLWFFIEVPLFVISFYTFFDYPFEYIIYNVLFVFLVIQNIFVIGKIRRKKILKPKITGRLLIILLILILLIFSIFYYIIYNSFFIALYSYILSLLLFPILFIFLSVIISQPLVVFLKNKKIIRALNKSRVIKKPIKVGITGSYGKTSIKEYLSCILEQDGDTLKTPENINSELGVADLVINKLNNSFKYFVAEMGAYRIGEIETLGKIVNHKYGFLTAVGNQHLGLFGGIENTKKAKSEIAKKVLENNGILYINGDDKNIKTCTFDKGLTIIKYGLSSNTDAKSVISGAKNGITKFEMEYKGVKYDFKTNLLGKHNIINITGVLAFCFDIGIKYTDLKKYLLNIRIPNNTLELINKDNNITYINDTYNLSEDGLLAGLDVLSSFEGEKVLIMDDILELGSNASKIHFELGKKIADLKLSDRVLFCGVNYKKEFIKGLIEGGFDSNNILKSLENINSNTTILLEGKKASKYLPN